MIEFEDLEPRHQKLVREVLEKYTEWLNQYRHEDEEFRYSPEWYLDQKVNEYAETQVEIQQDDSTGFYAQIVPYDGDEGGPATLYVYASREWHYKHLEKDFTKNDYTVILDDEYQLKFILQEFDTMFSPVYNGDPEKLYRND